jgi:hypothetical protein
MGGATARAWPFLRGQAMPPSPHRSRASHLSLTTILALLGGGVAISLANLGHALPSREPLPSHAATAQPAARTPIALPREEGRCSDLSVAGAFRDLFPPAPAAVRALGAERLALCHTRGAEGGLAAALPHSTDDQDGIAIASALSRLRTPIARDALREAVRRLAERWYGPAKPTTSSPWSSGSAKPTLPAPRPSASSWRPVGLPALPT